jgi:hypothetical protein
MPKNPRTHRASPIPAGKIPTRAGDLHIIQPLNQGQHA